MKTRQDIFAAIYKVTGNAHDVCRNDFGLMRELSEMRLLDKAILSVKREFEAEKATNVLELSRSLNEPVAEDFAKHTEGLKDND